MGYDTTFQGLFRLDRPLAPEHKNYLKAFSEVRHMTWNAELLEQMEEDPIREAVGLPLGEDGQYFAGSVAIRGHCFKHPALASMVIRPDLPQSQEEVIMSLPLEYPASGATGNPMLKEQLSNGTGPRNLATIFHGCASYSIIFSSPGVTISMGRCIGKENTETTQASLS